MDVAQGYLLDTNTCIRILNGTSPNVVTNLRRMGPSRIRLCAIVKAELVYGARRSTRAAENLRLLDDFFKPFTSLPFNDECADHYGVICQELERAGKPIGPNDLLIASIVLTHRLVLVTHNTREFSRIANLHVEDWEA